MRRTRKSLYAATVIAALAASGVAVAPAAQSAPAQQQAKARRQIPRTAPGWLGRAQSQGRAPAKTQSNFRLYLTPNGGTDALKAEVAKISDPASAEYQHYLSAAQYHAQFDPTQASVQTVKSWLQGKDLKVTGVAAQNEYLTVSGTNAAVEKAFAVVMKRFQKSDGEDVQANTSDVTVPDAVAPLIETVTGLDTSSHQMTHSRATDGPATGSGADSTEPLAKPSGQAGSQAKYPAGFRNAKPCSISYGQVQAKFQQDYTTPLPKFNGKVVPYAVCGYTGPQYRAAYEGATTLDGTGSTVAVVDAYASPSIVTDSNTYGSNHGDGSYAKGQLKQITPGSYTHTGTGPAGCDQTGWYGEETLDIEAVHAVAPGANINYYASKSCYDEDFLDTLAKVVNQDKSDVITNSWGEVEQAESAQAVAAYERVFMQAAAQGIGVTFSSGDNGDELQNTAIKQADYPASDPYVTAVGGTADAIDASGSLAFQTGWGTEKYSLSDDQKSWNPLGYLYGAGGGVSALFNQPSYQAGVVPSAFSGGRAVPDIAMDADPTTGMLVGETQSFPDGNYYSEYRIGGTSLASPLFAGLSALRQQNAGKRLGFQNPAIYKAAGTKVVNDVKGPGPDAGNVRVDYANGLDPSGGYLYSIRTFNQDSSLQTTKGWDEVTGVGSPNAGWLTTK